LHKAEYNQVFNLVRPYLDEADDRLFEKQVMRYRLNKEGSKFVAIGMWSKKNTKEVARAKQNQTPRIVGLIQKHWKDLCLAATTIAAIISTLIAIRNCA